MSGIKGPYDGPHRRYTACVGCLNDVIAERDAAREHAASVRAQAERQETECSELAEALRIALDIHELRGNDAQRPTGYVDWLLIAQRCLAAWDKERSTDARVT